MNKDKYISNLDGCLLNMMVMIIMCGMVVVGYYLLITGIKLLNGGEVPADKYHRMMDEKHSY